MEGSLAKRRQRMIDRAKARREGRRYGAFYEGYRGYLDGVAFDDCPHRGELARAWQNGWKYAEAES